MSGRVASLIELGAGFHPDLSGRENIYINAAIFGLKHKEIEARVKEIIEFSELEEFIDTPVRTYSSGMYMRLAFAVAINVDADILLIDEILAVGDAAFQAKCFNRMRDIKASGTTIVLVSHSLGQIEQLCDRSIWIFDGIVREDGKPTDVHPKYLDYMAKKSRAAAAPKQTARPETEDQNENKDRDTGTEKDKKSVDENTSHTDAHGTSESGAGGNPEAKGPKPEGTKAEDHKPEEPKEEPKEEKRYGSGAAKITGIRLEDKSGEDSRLFDVEDPITVRVSYKVLEEVKNAVFGIGIFRNDGLPCYGTNTRVDRLANFDLTKDGEFVIEIPRISFIAGKYWLDLAIESGDGLPVDYWKEAVRFEIVSRIEDVYIARVEHKWKLDI